MCFRCDFEANIVCLRVKAIFAIVTVGIHKEIDDRNVTYKIGPKLC